MKLIISENRIYDLSIKWLDKNYGDLIPYETKKYPDHVFFIKNGEIVFDYNKKHFWLGVSNDIIWMSLESVFGFEYHEVSDLLINWFGKRYELVINMIEPTEWHIRL
jgi:hypothetical protein